MSKRRQTVLICVLAAIASAMTFRVLLQREPRYEGKPLSIWLKDFDRWNGDTNAPVIQAVRVMGAEAAPILARAILTKNSPLKRSITGMLEKHLNLRLTSDSKRSDRAGKALSIMGKQARAAVPTFLKALTSDDPFFRREALNGLALLGPESEDYLPIILTLEQDPDASVRQNVIVALGCIGRRQDLCMLTLWRALEDSDPQLRHLAVVTLSKFSSELVLTKVGTNTNEPTTYPAADSLQKALADE